MEKYQGGCICGAVRYQSWAKPHAAFHCQCRHCQKMTGTGHASLLMVTKATTQVMGEIKYYDLIADDGNSVRSGFCPTCGNPVLTKSSGYAGMLFIHASTLDEPDQFNPQKLVWHAKGQQWDYIDPLLLRE